MLAQQGYYIDELESGMEASLTKTVSEADILSFAEISGDHNPVHVDEEAAKESIFGGRIAHGMLTASLISAVLGTKLPGPGCIYANQSLRFKAPVRIGDEVTAVARVKEVVPEKKRVVLETFCLVDDKPVLEGEAVMMVSKRP